MKSVLVIDDDPSLVRLIALVLKTHGFDVIEASNGLEALEVLNERVPSAIIVDLQMPFMDGRTFFKEIDGPGRPPTIIVSAYGAEKARRELGAEACLDKPFDPSALVEQIAKLTSDNY